ncbi:hypothetical protein ASPZODRAFT_137443 [Penicilliopsis zonata CBS 506.65]|uniref:Xylanolytic transcriptional activator regulatory domain-containing protein n=1 Tax=Penicilliopsis zonata CBS 506.65 TaxID=1073090 RepID=A0A1L9S4S7_9EURO|nr:hypothetical protein ASPZODRAFT_137443 [Penicilliopsis zonata CBS 506.65]OJJ42169.1 hypothetical protein ASPZODRAFT_137443 [Penicilliopsis zonata CBS 506.65]
MSAEERLHCLEKILSHCLGGAALGDEQLRTLAASVPSPSTPETAPETALASLLADGPDFSLGAFTRTIESAIAKKCDASQLEPTVLLGAAPPLEQPAADEPLPALPEHPHGPGRNGGDEARRAPLGAALSCLPPKAIAQFLVDVFLRYTQTNIYYVEEKWLYAFLDAYYAGPSALAGTTDAASVCTALMALACGTQFAHMEAFRLTSLVDGQPVHFSEDEVGRQFHQAACALMPDVIIAASFRSVQACLMMATYNFSLDSAGASYTYLSLALSLAVRNEMQDERRYAATADAVAAEVERRVWWTVYTLQKQVSLRYGRPRLLAHADVDVAQPTDLPELRPGREISNFDNQRALINLTLLLEAGGDEIAALRRTRLPVHFLNLFSLRRQLVAWRDRLRPLDSPWAPDTNVCRLRNDIHIHIYYWTTRLSLGRPFLLAPHPRPASPADAPDDAPDGRGRRHRLGHEVLVQDSVSAALQIIHLCELLRDRVGLSRASYALEFTCCRTAMLVLLAQNIAEPGGAKVRGALSRGLELLRVMAISSSLARYEVHVLEALENAILRLESATKLHIQAACSPNAADRSMYDTLQTWGRLWQHPPRGSLSSAAPDPHQGPHLPPALTDTSQLVVHDGPQHHPHEHLHPVDSFPRIHGPDNMDLESFSSELDQFDRIPEFNFSLDLLDGRYGQLDELAMYDFS